MAIMGLRASAQEIRFAILDKDDNDNIVFQNKDSENRLKYPATIDKIEDKLYWVKSEIDRILRINPQIEKIIIKMNEYSGVENGAKRETAYIDAIFMLAAKEHNIVVERKLNSQIASSSSQAKEYAERRVARTNKYWNNAMADAILVAYWGVKNDL